MNLTRVRVRTLLFSVWLSALVCAGVADILRVNAASNRVEVFDEHLNADGSTEFTLLWQHKKYYFLGPIPIGQYPIAVLSGAAFIASIMIWVLLKKGTKCKGASLDIHQTSEQINLH